MIPFLDTGAQGLYLSRTEVVWVSSVLRRNRLHTLERIHEPIERGNIAGAIERLVAKVRPNHPNVHTHLDPLHVRHFIAQGPAFDDFLAFEAWLQAEALRVLPPHSLLSDFVVQWQILEQTEEYLRCLLVLANRKAIEERISMLEAAGLEVLTIGSLDLAVCETLQLNPTFHTFRTAILLAQAEESLLIQYQDGSLSSWDEFNIGVSTAEPLPLLQETFSPLPTTPDMVGIVGEASGLLVSTAQEHKLPGGLVLEGLLDLSDYGKHEVLQGPDLFPSSLVLQQFYGSASAINFLDEERGYRNALALEKHESIRTILMVGSIILCLLVASLFLEQYLTSKLEQAEEVEISLSEKMSRIEQGQKTVKQLEADIAQAERLVKERTHTAQAIEGIGRMVPSRLWFENLVLTLSPTNEVQLTLSGVTFDEAEVALYLNKLEQASFTRNVRLQYTEQQPALRLYKTTTQPDQSLTKFEMQLEVTAPYQSNEEDQDG